MSERLTPAQFARAEKNKQRAVLLRKSRLARKPYHCVGIKQQAIDSGAGFLVDPDEEEEENNRVRQVETTGLSNVIYFGSVNTEKESGFDINYESLIIWLRY